MKKPRRYKSDLATLIETLQSAHKEFEKTVLLEVIKKIDNGERGNSFQLSDLLDCVSKTYFDLYKERKDI